MGADVPPAPLPGCCAYGRHSEEQWSGEANGTVPYQGGWSPHTRALTVGGVPASPMHSLDLVLGLLGPSSDLPAKQIRGDREAQTGAPGWSLLLGRNTRWPTHSPPRTPTPALPCPEAASPLCQRLWLLQGRSNGTSVACSAGPAAWSPRSDAKRPCNTAASLRRTFWDCAVAR